MSEYVRLPPLPDSNDLLRSMTVIPYLQDLYHGPGSQDEVNGQLVEDFNEHVITTIEGFNVTHLVMHKYCKIYISYM